MSKSEDSVDNILHIEVDQQTRRCISRLSLEACSANLDSILKFTCRSELSCCSAYPPHVKLSFSGKVTSDPLSDNLGSFGGSRTQTAAAGSRAAAACVDLLQSMKGVAGAVLVDGWGHHL